jgi:ATP-dependent Clp protease ATP-binding subunit ClpB
MMSTITKAAVLLLLSLSAHENVMAFVPSHHRVMRTTASTPQQTQVSQNNKHYNINNKNNNNHQFFQLQATPTDPSAASSGATGQDGDDPLEKFGVDFTARAAAGQLDPVIGRDDEIRRAIQILSRRTKNNPVLIGDPGVGKFV